MGRSYSEKDARKRLLLILKKLSKVKSSGGEGKTGGEGNGSEKGKRGKHTESITAAPRSAACFDEKGGEKGGGRGETWSHLVKIKCAWERHR